MIWSILLAAVVGGAGVGYVGWDMTRDESAGIQRVGRLVLAATVAAVLVVAYQVVVAVTS